MTAFVTTVGHAMGLEWTVTVEPLDDGTRLVIDGDECECLLEYKAEGLDALQHLVSASFRRDDTGGRVVVDCLDYRKGQDGELRETAKILATRAMDTGQPQELGPLNPYARRIVHLAVAEMPNVSSTSLGDAFLKTVVISVSDS